jgi:hypothetical protein
MEQEKRKLTIVNLTSVRKQFVLVASSAQSFGFPALGLAAAALPPVLARGTSSRSASSSASHCAASSRAISASFLTPDVAGAAAGREGRTIPVGAGAEADCCRCGSEEGSACGERR